MCRMVAYLGPPVPLERVLYGAPHSLQEQAYAPRESVWAHVHVDGTGVAWWPPGETRGDPLRYVSERPPWADPNLPGLSRRLEAPALLAAVRSATPGIPFSPGAVAPFVHGRLAGAHNGFLGAFRESTGRMLAARLPDDLYGALDVVSDSLLLFLTVAKYAREGRGLTEAVRAALTDTVEVCEHAGAPAALNLLVGDGEQIVGARASHGTTEQNSLSLLQGGPRWPGATLVASEPLDEDGGWEAVPEDHLVTVTPDGATVQALKLGRSAG